MSTISFKIEKLLEAKKLTKSEFARLLGVNRDTVYNLSDESIKVSTLIKVSEVLGTPLEHFLSNNDGESQQKKKIIKSNVHLTLESDDILKIDLKNKRLEIIKK